MKKYILMFALLAVICAPVVAQAVTVDELQAKIVSLEQQIANLRYALYSAIYNSSIVSPIVEPAPIVIPLPKPVITPKPIVPTLPIVFPIVEPVVPTTSIPRPINTTLPSGLIVNPSVPTTGIVPPVSLPIPSTIVTPSSVSVFTRDLNINFSGVDVKAFQQYLFDNKFLTTAPTGFFGPATCLAAINWKRSKNLSADTCFIGSLSRTILNNSFAERNLIGLGAVSVEKKASTPPVITPPSGPYKIEANFVNQSNPANAQISISKVVPSPIITSLSNVSCPCSGLSCPNAGVCTTAYMSGTIVRAQITSPSVVGYSWVFRNYVPGSNRGIGYPAVTKLSGCSQTPTAQDTFCEFLMPTQNIELHIEASSQPAPLTCTSADLAKFSVSNFSKMQLSTNPAAVSLKAQVDYIGSPTLSTSGFTYKTNLVYWPSSQPSSSAVPAVPMSASGPQPFASLVGTTTSSLPGLYGKASPLVLNTPYVVGVLVKKYATSNPAVTAECIKVLDAGFSVSST